MIFILFLNRRKILKQITFNSFISAIVWWAFNGILLMISNYLYRNIMNNNLFLGLLLFLLTLITASSLLILIGRYIMIADNNNFKNFISLFPINIVIICILSVVFSAGRIVTAMIDWLPFIISNLLEFRLSYNALEIFSVILKIINFFFVFIMLLFGMSIKQKSHLKRVDSTLS